MKYLEREESQKYKEEDRLSFICKSLTIKDGEKILVDDISFVIEDSFALVGESGSGKSLSLKAILGMLPQNLTSSFDYDSPFELKRGDTVSIVVQNPFTALSPLTKIKNQFLIEEQKAREYMKMVELDEDLLERYPPELSGGQLQRVTIAFALSCNPKLLLLDEPTTALDSQSKDGILELINSLQKQNGFKTLFVTHDIDSSLKICEKIAIIRDGKIIEQGDILEVVKNPKQKYTKTLIESSFKNREFRI